MEIENQETNTKPYLSLADRWRIMHFKELGYSGDEVSKIDAFYLEWQETGDVINLPKTGRPKEVTVEESKMVLETIKSKPDLSLTQLKIEPEADISRSSCYGILKENNYKSRTAADKWKIDESNQAARLKWAKKYISQSDEFWQK